MTSAAQVNLRKDRRSGERVRKLAERRIKRDPDKLRMLQASDHLRRQRDKAIQSLDGAFQLGQEEMQKRAVVALRDAALHQGGSLMGEYVVKEIAGAIERIEGLKIETAAVRYKSEQEEQADAEHERIESVGDLGS